MTLPYPDPDPKPAHNRRCIACGVGEHYRPGEWIVGRFRAARFNGVLPPIVVGPMCGDCAARTGQCVQSRK